MPYMTPYSTLVKEKEDDLRVGFSSTLHINYFKSISEIKNLKKKPFITFTNMQ